MSSAAEFDWLLDRAVREGAHAGRPRPSPAELASVRQGRDMPRELAAVYARVDGLELPRVELFDLGDFADVNGDTALFAQLPGVVFIGSDRGDGFFLLDPQDSLGCSPGAVFWADRGILEPDACRLAAASFLEFLGRALDGQALNDGREVGALSLEQLVQAVEARPDAVVAHPGFGEPGAMLAARKLDQPISFGLSDFYAQFDGLFLRDMNLRIFGLTELGAISGNGETIALWFGRDQTGRRYGLTVGGWRGFPANRLFVVRHESEIGTAAILGRFTDVLRTWIAVSPPGDPTP